MKKEIKSVGGLVRKLQPCPLGKEFIKGCSSLKEAWATCPNPEWMLWALGHLASRIKANRLSYVELEKKAIVTFLKRTLRASRVKGIWDADDLNLARKILAVGEGKADPSTLKGFCWHANGANNYNFDTPLRDLAALFQGKTLFGQDLDASNYSGPFSSLDGLMAYFIPAEWRPNYKRDSKHYANWLRKALPDAAGFAKEDA